jgi:hypothetical protein
MNPTVEDVRAYYVRLATSEYDVELHEVGAGVCDDCDEHAEPRYRFGNVRICLHDLIARSRFRAREAA